MKKAEKQAVPTDTVIFVAKIFEKQVIKFKNGGFMKKKNAFTLAEVLITLGIIGIVAAMTLPVLIQKQQDVQFKAAYKKAYSDLSQAFALAIAEDRMPYRVNKYDEQATGKEWDIMKEAFKVTKECDKNNTYDCWKPGDTLCGGSCTSGNPSDGISEEGAPREGNVPSFVDASGRSWTLLGVRENIYIVDTNGFKGPNKFGKDRWYFVLGDKKGNRISNGIAVKVIVDTDDKLTRDSFCKYPPCYYRSWLLN